MAFRSWRRPTVVQGGTLRSPVGVLRIDEVAAIEPKEVSLVDARLAGFETVDAVLAGLPTEPGRRLYRIRFHLEGDDPRIALRTAAELDADDRGRIGRVGRSRAKRSVLVRIRPEVQGVPPRSATNAGRGRAGSVVVGEGGRLPDTLR